MKANLKYKLAPSKVKNILGSLREPNFIFSNILVPLIVLILYFVSYAYLLSSVRLLPQGVNYVFVSRSWKYLLPLLVGVFLIWLFITRPNKTNGKTVRITATSIKPSVSNSLLLLLPLTPVIQYIINNQAILSPFESLYALSVFLFLASLYIFAVPMLLGFAGSTKVLMFLGLAFVCTLMSMALLSRDFKWYEEGSLKIQWMFFAAVFLVTWILFNFNGKRILVALIVMVFLTNSASQLLSPSGSQAGKESPDTKDNRLLALIGERTPVTSPNIYLLVYDSYVPNETMLAYGIDNGYQEEYLANLGFTLYPHTYSLSNNTAGTMSRVLNASTAFYGDKRRAVSGDGVIQNALKHFGYETYGIFASDYFFQRSASTYDFSFPERDLSSATLVNAILIGEFRFDLGFDEIPREQFVQAKQDVFESISGKPAFIYMHSYSPGHSQNSGSCLPDETYRYAQRLKRANAEMRQDIETITKNDASAIIIIAGDHGPYLTKNCTSTGAVYDISEISRLDIQDRYGTFLAIKWPTEDFTTYDDIPVLQDLFPAVFAYLCHDAGILDSRVDLLTLESGVISGATVQGGTIYGGINDGEPLFVADR